MSEEGINLKLKYSVDFWVNRNKTIFCNPTQIWDLKEYLFEQQCYLELSACWRKKINNRVV
ncbi:hypothetical protein B6U67_03170 [Methanosarcinales archaeon ex4484_138]|nr:MAG: hypothetical protein B6U67_03170 [Methanosarcinales archaeon ex4484_138]